MKTLFFVAFISIISFTVLAQRPEVGSVCKVYIGKEGLAIATCRVGPEPKNEVLLKFSGIDHPWNNKIFIATATKFKNNSTSSEFNIDYQISEDGKTYTVLTYRSEIYTAYLPPYGTLQTEHKLRYDEYRSGQCRPDRLLTEYLEK